MSEIDPAHIIFASDVPASSTPPDWWASNQNAAEMRLAGRHSPKPAAPAGEQTDAAGMLFSKDAKGFDDQPTADFFGGFATSARADGDLDRAAALEAAGAALVADFKAAGSNAAELSEALDIVRERQSDTVAGPVSAARLAEDFASTMAALSGEGVSMSDINAARAFILDLETISPGTMATLEQTGAGNDPKLIAKAIAEARRRGY